MRTRLGPITRLIARSVGSARPTQATMQEQAEEANEVAKAYLDTAEQEGIIELQSRQNECEVRDPCHGLAVEWSVGGELSI